MSSIGGISIGSLQFLASFKQRLAAGAEAGHGFAVNSASPAQTLETGGRDALGVRCSPLALDALISLQEHSIEGGPGGAKCGTGSAALVDRLFDKFDADGDGQITKTELEAAVAVRNANAARTDALFGKLDANGDGTLSKDELKDAFAFAASLAERLFAKLDVDGDGKISQAEFQAAFDTHGSNAKRAEILFANLDADGDGAISQSELAAAIERRHHRERDRDEDSTALPLDALMKTAATSETTTAADGSTTTVHTFADGTEVTVVKPAAERDI